MSSPSQPPPASVLARVEDSVFAIRKRVEVEPAVGVVLGSGLGAFADTLTGIVRIPYGELPHMQASSVAGHTGAFCFGSSGGVAVVCMQGRLHLYEGHPIDRVVHGVRTMARLGVQRVLLTNAAGGLDATWAPGDLMVIADHINMTGASPLVGPNDPGLGPRFVDMTTAYDPALRARLHVAARAIGLSLREGVYACMLGPQYETPAEIRMLQQLGAHAVGMSTVHEVIALRHMEIPVAALSCITNLAAGLGTAPLNHEEVERTAQSQRDTLIELLRRWVSSTSEASA
jgi:purine-nucleoside phosphorylase